MTELRDVSEREITEEETGGYDPKEDDGRDDVLHSKGSGMHSYHGALRRKREVERLEAEEA